MNAFEAFADETKPAWQKRKERIADTRAAKTVTRNEERKLEREKEEAGLARIASAWRRARLEELEAGPYGKEIKGLRTFMRTMTLSSAPALVTLIERAVWLKGADTDTKYDVLDLVSRGITSLRVRNGMTPFDDPLPPDTNAFIDIREMML